MQKVRWGVLSTASIGTGQVIPAMLLFVLILFVFSSAYIFQRIAWKLSVSGLTPREMKRK